MDMILGQTRVIETLQAALRSGKVHHAWIFHGPLGVGKFTTAIEFAKLLLDPDATTDLAGNVSVDPQGHVAHLVDSRNHPDLHEIRKELALTSADASLRNKKLTNIPIGVLREHMIGGHVGESFQASRVFSTPRMGHGKVFIVDEAELLDPVGQNAMLKTLEEPPPNTWIILLTTQPERLLPTISSRCQRVGFAPLPEPEMQTWFARRKLELNNEEQAFIEHFADGSPGMAELAVEDGLLEWMSTLHPVLRQVESGRFPVHVGETLAGLVDLYATAWVKNHDNASKDVANKGGSKRVFMLLAAYVRRQLHAAAQTKSDIEKPLAIISIIHEAETALGRNVNMKFVFENLMAQWTQICSGHALSV